MRLPSASHESTVCASCEMRLPFCRCLRIARAIYGNSNFWTYGAMANPPIHIIVENGRVTLEGVVNSNVDRMLARSIASSFGAFSVTNNLKTDSEVTKDLERL
jgi:BON domain-containing protein